MADLIKQSELKDRMKKIPEWELEKNQIERTFEFDDFVDAIDFVDRVAEVVEEEEHHPDIDIRYNKVRLTVSTHSKGGLTELDFNLAERIEPWRNRNAGGDGTLRCGTAWRADSTRVSADANHRRQ